MTGNIGDILAASDAVRSLLMEKRVADKIKEHSWKVDTGIYYVDQDTNKLREMDVFGIQALNKPQKAKGIGAPLINLYLNCECKSLSGHNVLFLPDTATDQSKAWTGPLWLGREVETIVSNFAEQAKIVDHGKIKKLYDYVTARAYPGGGKATIAGVVMDPPPVDITAWSFRETRGGKDDGEHSSDRGQATPVWGAIRAAIDAARAARHKAKVTSLEWVYGLDLKFHGVVDFSKSAAFFLDSELFRSEFFHSIVIVDARLWKVDASGVTELKSARLFVSNIDHSNSYVDIVNSGFIDEYVDSMVRHYERSARRSISNQWKLIEEVGWEPGQAKEKLLSILRLKPSKKNVRRRFPKNGV